FSPDGKWLVSGALDGHIKIWDLEAGKEHKDIGPVSRVPGLIFLPDSKRFVAWVLEPKSESDSVSTLPTYEAAPANVVETFSDRNRAVTCGVFSSDGELSATGDTQGTVRIFQIAKKERFRGDLPAHAKAMADLALSADKKTLITGDDDGEV